MSQEHDEQDGGAAKFDVPGLLNKSFGLFMEQPALYGGAGLVVWFGLWLGFGIAFIVNLMPVIGFILFIVVNVAVCAFAGIMMVGLLGMAREGLRGERPSFDGLFYAFGPPLTPVAIAYAVIGVCTMIGTALCILPGLIVQFLFMLTPIYLLDGERDFWAAMEKSRKLVLTDVPQWLLVFVLVFAINLVGMIACTIGLIVSIPVTALILAQAFDQRGEESANASVLDPPFD